MKFYFPTLVPTSCCRERLVRGAILPYRASNDTNRRVVLRIVGRRLRVTSRCRVRQNEGTGCRQNPVGILSLQGIPSHPRARSVAPECPKVPVRLTDPGTSSS